MEGLRFSVIVPLYNKASYIARTLRSIISQTFDNYELIVVDDGSTDNSYDVAYQIIGKENPRWRIVQQANAGVGAARNYGVSFSSGSFVCFLDSDDWWEPGFLEELDRIISCYPNGGLYGTAYYLVKNGQQRPAPIRFNKDFHEGPIDYCNVFWRNLCMPITSSSVAIPRELFLQMGGFNPKLTFGEDFDLWVRIAMHNQVIMSDKKLSNYFQDISPKRRATRRLHNPDTHVLWNIDYLAEDERRNRTLKRLLDCLRVDGLFYYYLSSKYHLAALQQLQKVDWTLISQRSQRKYNNPMIIERIRYSSLRSASVIKQTLIRLKSSTSKQL